MTVGVIAEFRNRDLGSTLVKRVISAVEVDKTCGTIYLHVITHNLAAIHFYEKLGFYRVKEIQDYYKIDGKNHNCYLYAKYFHGKFGFLCLLLCLAPRCSHEREYAKTAIGNRGQRDLYHLASTCVLSIWKRLTETLRSY